MILGYRLVTHSAQECETPHQEEAHSESRGRSQLTRCYHTRRWIRCSPVQTRPGSIDGSRVVDLQHVKEPQAKIRASEQNLSDFSLSL